MINNNDQESSKKDTRWSITIIRAENGWFLEYWEEIEDDKWRKIERVYEDHNEEHGEKLSTVDTLRDIVEYFGQRGSKHDARRIDIRYTKDWDKDDEEA